MHIITMLALLSILILIHELGHFWAARKLGIRVEKFGFGLPFGPLLYKTKWGDTEICVHSFLLGGYVSFPDDEPDSAIPKDSHERIANRKIWERFVVVSAGVTANAILAYLIVLFVAIFSGGLPSGKYNIFVEGLQADKKLSAHQTGVMPGDKIISANGANIDSLNKFIQIVQRSKKFDGYVTEEKIEQKKQALLKLNPFLKDENGTIPSGMKVMLPESTPEAAIKIPNDPLIGASKYTPAGIELSKDQKTLRNSLEGKNKFIANGKVNLQTLAVAVADSSHPVLISIKRDGTILDLKPAFPNQDGMIGVKLRVEEISEKINTPLDVFVNSWDYLYRNASYMIQGLGMIITGKIPLNDVHGIVAITKVGSDIIEKKGMWDGLLLTALISIDLAIVNLLPIPALDGGHIMFLFIEKLRGRPVEEKTQELFAKYGFIFLIGLMVIIVLNDIFALITDKL